MFGFITKNTVRGGIILKNIVRSIFIVIILAGCKQTSSFHTNGQTEGIAIIDDQSYTMAIGDYEWRDHDLILRSLSGLDIYELSEAFDTLHVDKGATVNIQFDHSPSSIKIKQWNEDHSNKAVELYGDEWTLPVVEGHYIYEVIVEWNNGKATYAFDVHVN